MCPNHIVHENHSFLRRNHEQNILHLKGKKISSITFFEIRAQVSSFEEDIQEHPIFSSGGHVFCIQYGYVLRIIFFHKMNTNVMR